VEKWGFSIIHSMRGGDDGDMVFVWNNPVCIVAFKPYLQQVFRKELEKNQEEDDIKRKCLGRESNSHRDKLRGILSPKIPRMRGAIN
jgi:hypothetical protein